MSDSVISAPLAGSPKTSKIPEAVIRIAGNSQDGIQAIGGFLARLAGRTRAGGHDFHDHSLDDLRGPFHFSGADRVG